MTMVIKSNAKLRTARRARNRSTPRRQLGSRIQQTALRLFRERGFDNTSVDEIVAEADVAKGTFFNFYPTKQAVLAGYYDEMESFMTARLMKLDPEDPAGSLVDMFRTLERRLRAEGDLACVLFREIERDSSLRSADVKSANDDFRHYKSFFERCRADGSIDKGVSDSVTAEIVQDLWSSSVQRWFRTQQSFSLADALKVKIDVLFAGLKPRSGDAKGKGPGS
jgi:AcrR family transcriptional regulator